MREIIPAGVRIGAVWRCVARDRSSSHLVLLALQFEQASLTRICTLAGI